MKASGRPPSLRSSALIVGVLAACSAAAQQQTDESRVAASKRTIVVGPTQAQRASNEATVELPFAARADEDLTAASIEVAFARATGHDEVPDVAAVSLFVNDERVATVAIDPGAARMVTVHRDLLGPRNMLSVRLLDHAGRLVGRRGAWNRVAAVRLHLATSPSPLPNDLALLPLPFIDRDVDGEAAISIVIPGPPTPERVRAAALVASWIALDAPVPVSFTVSMNEVPDGRAIILADDQAQAERLGLAPLETSLLRMVDTPRHPGSNGKWLVVGGRNPVELRVAAESLAGSSERFVGSEVRLRAPSRRPPATPYSAPRWLPSGRAVAFRDFPLGATPSHDGTSSATLPVRFRIAPDLAIWPANFVTMDLRWTERLPAGVPPPRLDLEMNGYFLATLPAAPGPGEFTRSIRLRIPRQHIRGFNELLLHVRFSGASSPGGVAARVAISGDSVIHLEHLEHFAALPDMGLLVYDGFPFTRVPDLGETAVVLPEHPNVSELSAVVTLLAQFAQVTGRAGTRASFIMGGPGDRALADKDVLVVAPADGPLMARWRQHWPLRVAARRARLQPAARSRPWLQWTGGLGHVLDRRRASAVLERGGDIGVVMAIESPVSAGRTVVAVTSTSIAGLPAYRDFLGYAESRTLTGDDVLLLAGGRRWMFRIGPSFEHGRLAPWNEVRWFLASHWLLLIPLLVIGAWLLGRVGMHAITTRMRERLAATGGSP